MKIINVSDLMNVTDLMNNKSVEHMNDIIPKHKATVMVYMMKNCPHCVDLKPKWDMVKTQMSNDATFKDVLAADIDSSASNALFDHPPVMGFPTIRVLKEGGLHEYSGAREVDPILSFMKKIVSGRTSPSKQTHRKTRRVRSSGTRSSRRSSGRRSHGTRSSGRRSHRRTHRKRPSAHSMRESPPRRRSRTHNTV